MDGPYSEKWGGRWYLCFEVKTQVCLILNFHGAARVPMAAVYRMGCALLSLRYFGGAIL